MDTPTPTRTSRLINRSPINYAWVVLVAGIIASIMSSPGQTYAFSIYIEHFITDLGISRGLVSTLYTVGTLTASLFLPWVGRAIDKRGTRVVVTVVATALALGCLYMSSIQGAVMLAFGIFVMRFLGQSSLTLCGRTLINHWWVRRRGLALGLAGLVGSILGTGLFPTFANGLIERYGWRPSYWILGAIVAVVMIPIGWGLFRRPPEAYGLEPDGGLPAPKPREGADGDEPLEQNFSSAQAVRTPAFWIASAGMAAMSMLTTGLHFHMVGIGADAGLSTAEAAMIYVPLSITGAVVILASGILVDRIPVKYILSLALVLQAVSLVMARFLNGSTMAFGYGMVLGATSGLANSVSGVLWPAYYGRKHLGAITGITQLVMAASSALGPMPLGIARDLLGSYGATLTILAILPAALSMVCLTIKRPTLPDTQAS